MQKEIIGRLPTIPEYYRDWINKNVDLIQNNAVPSIKKIHHLFLIQQRKENGVVLEAVSVEEI